MSKQAQQGGGGGGDNSLAPIWITLLLFITVYIIWYAAHEYIVSFVFTMNIYQAKLVQLFINPPGLQSTLHFMQTADPAAVEWDQLMDASKGVGEFIRFPVIVILASFALILYLNDLKNKFRKTHSMKTLRAQEQYNWPAIMPIIKEDLAKSDINAGPWAMALTPMEFAKKHQLLKKDDLLAENAPSNQATAGIRKGDAKRVFTLQLGPYWEGFQRCPPHVCALAAVFMARLNRDREAAKLILTTIDKSFAEGKPNYTDAQAVLNKYKNKDNVRQCMGKHAYLLPALASLLQGAREDGVVPTSEFLWLKVVDRRLWYMLNSVGRQTPFAEVAGPFAHWRAEQALGRRSLMPMVDEAIKALEIAVKEIKLSPQILRELTS